MLSAGGAANILGTILFIALFCYGFFVLYLLSRRHITAPQHAQRLVVLFLLFDVYTGIQNWYETGNQEVLAIAPWRGFLFWFVWMMWLQSSTRVANT